MLERPDIQDSLLIAQLQHEYGLPVTQVSFLPLGADVDTAVYRVLTAADLIYFLKLRKGDFDEAAVAVPWFLKSQGIQAVIAPLETVHRQLWGSVGVYRMILYPYVEGGNGYAVTLAGQHWIDLGTALKGVHTAHVPPTLARLIPRETYSPRWHKAVQAFQEQAANTHFADPVAAKLAGFMQNRRDEISHMVTRAGQLALALQARSGEFVLCHSDIHPGNLLIGTDGSLYIVDWDNPIFAPKERDLMFIGAGMAGDRQNRGEAALFYQGYGPADVDQTALAYYRYERIIADIAAFCAQLFLTAEGGADREQSYRYFTGQFLPGYEVETAFETDPLGRQ